jgi:hypothetical protein
VFSKTLAQTIWPWWFFPSNSATMQPNWTILYRLARLLYNWFYFE